MLLAFDDEWDAAQRLGQAARLAPVCIARHRFPDGEIKLTLPPALPPRVVLLRSLAQPNEKLVELLLASRAARELGAAHLTLVAPYLAYMRQDMAFAPGEAVSQRIVGAFLATLFDRVITVDPHLHRIDDLRAAIPLPEAVSLSAAPAIGAFLRQRVPGALLLGPDAESAQWVEQAAAAGGFAWGVATKQRHGDRDVRIALPALALRGREVVLLDDVASTGSTLAQAARAVYEAGAARVYVAVTHGLFVDGALAALRQAGVEAIWSADTVPHPTNAITVLPLLARALAA
ncbi:MAG: ribose-phosphate diphosphokinase [Burkholderiaceae bacterium]|nr:ribose-phosphate diphosphokinase [Burkholderiaceae bacterium]